MIDTSAYRGLEFDWIGVDADGHVALFTSGGGGLIPPLPSLDIESHDAAIAAILALPPSTTARFAPTLDPRCTNTWQLVAERGLYAYDSSPNADPYQHEAAPTVAIHVGALPSSIVATFVRLRADLCFETRARITMADL